MGGTSRKTQGTLHPLQPKRRTPGGRKALFAKRGGKNRPLVTRPEPKAFAPQAALYARNPCGGANIWTAAIVGDLQCPYSDPRAVSVAGQIIESVKPDILRINGDGLDLRSISRYPLTHDEEDSRIENSLSGELEKSRSILKEFIKHCGAKKTEWADGNHEWRILRAFEREERALRLIGLKVVKDALSTPAIVNFNAIGVDRYIGAYPKGDWLHSRLDEHSNVWVEHGYRVNKHAGYTASNLMRDRMASVIVNHVEKLAGPMWTRALGKDYFCIENGNLSLIGEPGLGDGLYGGVPHSEPRYMCHRQGFSLLFYESGQWFPFTVKIREGKAVWGGKLYKS